MLNGSAWRRAHTLMQPCYDNHMNENQIAAIIERVRQWPRERQEEAAQMLLLIEEHDGSPFRLSHSCEIRLACYDGIR